MEAHWYLLEYYLSLLLGHYKDFPYVHTRAYSLEFLRELQEQLNVSFS